MLEYFLQRRPKGCTKKSFQRVDLLHTELKALGQNYQTPFYADRILKYWENRHKIYLSVGNSCNFEVISKSKYFKTYI